MEKLTPTKAATRINCVYSHYRRLNDAIAKAKRTGLRISFNAMPPELLGIDSDDLSDEEKESIKLFFLERGSNDGIDQDELSDTQIKRQDFVDNTIVAFFYDHKDDIPNDEEIQAFIEDLKPFKWGEVKKDKVTWAVIAATCGTVGQTALSIDYADSVVREAVDQIKGLLEDYYVRVYRRRVDMEFYPYVS